MDLDTLILEQFNTAKGNLKHIDIDGLKVITIPPHPHFATTEKRIAKALAKAEKSKSAEVRKARKQLEKAQKELAASRKEMRLKREQALKQLEKLSELSEG